ncbi:MAG: hypothetical protein KDG55_01425 [Rhodocyclaceae bacterium]|nr:hypothetical protein [Rhodocyclaceae bacterium]
MAASLTASLCWAASGWAPLADDGLHDPNGPGIRLLQQPGDALSNLPGDTAGNNVHWIPALQKGVIVPREKIGKDTPVRRYDRDVFLNLYGSMPAVRFPHKPHTEWLDCSNCHDQLFKPKAGANQISMFVILQGQQCGVCHGAVAFPLTECRRCHSVANDLAQRLAAEQAIADAQPDAHARLEQMRREASVPLLPSPKGTP